MNPIKIKVYLCAECFISMPECHWFVRHLVGINAFFPEKLQEFIALAEAHG